MAVEREVKLESAQDLSVSHARIQELLALIEAFRSGAALSELLFKRKADPTKYEYSFTGADGRTWAQEVRWTAADDPDIDPPMDFATGFWRSSEFAPQRETRQRLIDLRASHGLTLFRAKWTTV